MKASAFRIPQILWTLRMTGNWIAPVTHATPMPLVNFTTTVRVLFGEADGSAAVALKQEWLNVITPSKSQAYLPLAQHSLPGYTNGEQQIVTDIKAMCK